MYKVVRDNYIIAVSSVNVGTEITEEEYALIREALKNKPSKDGYYAKLKEDLTWELFEIPPSLEESQATETDYQNALAEMGVDLHE